MMKIRRRYIRPSIEKYVVDQDVSLVLMSSTEEKPGEMPGPTTIQQQTDTFEANPFDETNIK
ncbi:hypothetical protein [Carboxylicivirga sp. M1479]|uniref:hypothetical protein n=1 Tax=Carboxylicivirga sp. M1479 TaxID=2594476 RepID=UPI001177BEE4|nr:hypothetical protein [Carboxylicivirga sp. M1479]TRX65689.1 hypothetical protein FNN09_17300 [Carboxylicivirga sp. M1479]